MHIVDDKLEFEPTWPRSPVGRLSTQRSRVRFRDRGQANFSACPVWMHIQTQSNVTNMID